MNEKGKFAAETVVMPGLDTFWECNKGRNKKPNYVRHATDARFDMGSLDLWDRLVLRFKAQALYRIQIKVIDVDRPDFWDKITDALSGLIGAVMGKAKAEISNLPVVGDSLGSFAEDVQSTIAKLLAGGDKLLYKGSEDLNKSTISIGGDGSADKDKAGTYTIEFARKAIP